MLDFVAIDFETATCKYDSACSVAAVEIKDGIEVSSYYTLIRPPENRYDWRNTRVHGLRARDTAEERSFTEIWPELCAYLAGKIVAAHNAPFDMGVLRQSLEARGLALPRFDYFCTVRLSQKVWPELESHKLNVMGEYLGVDFKHHHALEDARACAAIPVAAMQRTGKGSLPDLLEALGINLKDFSAPVVKKPKRPWRRKQNTVSELNLTPQANNAIIAK